MTSETKLKADLFLTSDNCASFASSQAELLKAIDDCGSISKAARQIGISYKTAWDRIDAMNNMSVQPLVIRTTGGAQGGGTELTELGKKILEGFQDLQEEHQLFISQLGSKLHSLSDLANFIRGGSMKTSARNQYLGRVTKITPGAVNTEIILAIGDAQDIVANITNDSLENLQLLEGSSASALVKASWVLISKEIGIKTSARNQLVGKVSRISEGAVNSDVSIDLGNGKSISAVITNISLKELELREGDDACALFKASSVILMTA